MRDTIRPSVSSWLALAFALAPGVAHADLVGGFVRDASGVVTTFQIPGSQSLGVNIASNGTVYGSYSDSTGASHGFVRDASGGITSIDVPGSMSTGISGMNAQGEIVGNYIGRDPVLGTQFLAYTRDASGTITTLDTGGRVVITQAINDSGTVLGYFPSASGPSGFNPIHGFLASAAGAITTFDPPGSQYTDPTALNNQGLAAGYFATGDPFAGSPYHGFTRDASGNFVTFDAPGATGTFVFGVNQSGTVVGDTLAGPNGSGDYGFLRDAAGNFTTFTVGGGSTVAIALNDAGQVGGYSLVTGAVDTFRGYVRAADGSVATFDAALPPDGMATRTFVQGIDAAGDVAGFYNFVPVPEPSSLVLLASGVAGLLGYARRRAHPSGASPR